MKVYEVSGEGSDYGAAAIVVAATAQAALYACNLNGEIRYDTVRELPVLTPVKDIVGTTIITGWTFIE